MDVATKLISNYSFFYFGLFSVFPKLQHEIARFSSVAQILLSTFFAHPKNDKGVTACDVILDLIHNIQILINSTF